MSISKQDIAELMEASKHYRRKCRPWSVGDTEIVRRFYGTVDVKLLATKLDRTIPAIQQFAARLTPRTP